jgi:hypothetical protein
MPHVADFCVSHAICEKKPTFSFAAGDSQLTFDAEVLMGLRDKVEVSAVK